MKNNEKWEFAFFIKKIEQPLMNEETTEEYTYIYIYIILYNIYIYIYIYTYIYHIYIYIHSNFSILKIFLQ